MVASLTTEQAQTHYYLLFIASHLPIISPQKKQELKAQQVFIVGNYQASKWLTFKVWREEVKFK